MNHAGGGLAQEIPVPENEQRLSVLRGHGAALEIASVAPEASVICTGSTYASEKVGAYTPHREVRPMTMTIRTPTNIFVEVDMRRVE